MSKKTLPPFGLGASGDQYKKHMDEAGAPPSWSELRGSPAIRALYTEEIFDGERLPFAIRDHLGDALNAYRGEPVSKLGEQKALNTTVHELVSQEAAIKELWDRWTKLPLPGSGPGKARKHTHKSLYTALAKAARRELRVWQGRDEDKTEQRTAVDESDAAPETLVVVKQEPEEEEKAKTPAFPTQLREPIAAPSEQVSEILALLRANRPKTPQSRKSFILT